MKINCTTNKQTFNQIWFWYIHIQNHYNKNDLFLIFAQLIPLVREGGNIPQCLEHHRLVFDAEKLLWPEACSAATKDVHWIQTHDLWINPRLLLNHFDKIFYKIKRPSLRSPNKTNLKVCFQLLILFQIEWTPLTFYPEQGYILQPKARYLNFLKDFTKTLLFINFIIKLSPFYLFRKVEARQCHQL